MLLICARSLISVCTNLIAQVSRIQGHEIRVVLYARLDGDCRLYKVDYVVYILIHLPPSNTQQQPPVYILVRPAKRLEVGDYGLITNSIYLFKS